MINFPLLTSEDIEVKPKQITKTGALLLLYKTSRTDARILDETVGIMNWTDSYSEIKGNLYCSIGIRENPDQDFVFKTDCGIESDQKDDDRKKAECSDAFKRCCSKLGIGRELYTSPQIWANVATEQNTKGDWVLKDPYAKYIVTKIGYNEKTRVITELVIANAKTNTVVFEWKMPENAAMKSKMVKTLNKDKAEVTKKAPEAQKEAVIQEKKIEVAPSATTVRTPLKTLVSSIGAIVKKMMKDGVDMSVYSNIVAEVAGSKTFKCNQATEDQYDIVAGIYDRLVKEGYSQN